jgi:nucleoside 2-deoxyribosyltransferase
MPFLAELNYFYLYMKRHIEDKYNIRCQRADESILTTVILEKIDKMILESDFIIADCTGRNGNVMYELGIAHAHNKDVVLLTKDEISEAPSDIRHFEFIKYNLSDAADFTNKLDNAMSNLITQYDELYGQARELFHTFKSKTNLEVKMASKDQFVSRVRFTSEKIPVSSNEALMIQFLLPKIIADSPNIQIMQEITKFGTADT